MRCVNERRQECRRSSDKTTKWRLMVTMGVLFIGWSGAVYIHFLVTSNV
jgi:hypothetical protein